jgi:hypothetical protein
LERFDRIRLEQARCPIQAVCPSITVADRMSVDAKFILGCG